MPLNLALFQLREILDISPENILNLSVDLRMQKISTDSRTLEPGDIFLALRGESFDGHRFLEIAIQKGAIALIVEEPLPLAKSSAVTQFVVPNTLIAYQKIAHWWRNQFQIPIVGVTGSVGKTTTKELIAAVLSKYGQVHKTEANYNNEIGVPKTLLEITAAHDYAIIEMAMRGRGEIALLTQIAQPTIGLITNVGTAHIGRLGSEQAIAEAKCELLAEMPDSSLAILNADNERLCRTAKTVWSGQTLTYGLTQGDIRGELLDSQTLLVENQVFPLPLPGAHNASNYLAALTVARVLGLDWQPFTQGLTVNLPSGRARRDTIGTDILLLDETYNAGLESMVAALQLLKETPGQRQIAVLGAMKELGERSPEFHRQVGERAKQLGIDRLFILANDPEAEEIALGAKGMTIELFNTHEALSQRLQVFLGTGDRVLFKASHSVGLDRVVEQLRQAEKKEI
jgi:UDP-N-acetylmuramoyl-tripeptide--D-alanyl-D-alanine ligase